ncbi:iron transporter [Magnetovibrio blakemorei]|uniref:Periplasmic copper handling protein n=1 Tax=Magnetovibrio blakemorei TaxID=28181 RepID=Q6PPC2_9PROT|nr:iron transporter [Magnetovibrio blakemorei]AAT01654.1 periplasmic copper handling protein [Magnetovibrio blakemorei]AAT01655.1 periplasmic copper handling protein [Magnetovibrio blakemorei]OEJ68078.1 hypothetical protein BEN30_07410 [Magnetovibrio blakemorei]
MHKKLLQMIIISVMAATIGTTAATAGEQPAGEPIVINGMEVMGIFLQPVDMEPAMHDQGSAVTDIHLEADIHAVVGNENGFAGGEWIPYLNISYELTKSGSDWKKAGMFMGMVASDGPHYGANVKLDGAGEYNLVFHIQPPEGHAFMRHTDKETGVGPWWKPFDYTGSFIFAGAGKKGGY